jgi:ABC-type enterochelin transport system substrate-binding protein
LLSKEHAMAPAFSFALVIAFIFAVAQSAELGKAQNQFRSFLNNDLLAKAKAGTRGTIRILLCARN